MSFINNPATCTHKRGQYEDVEVDPGDDFYGVPPTYERQWVEYSTVEDLDLHRMQCTQCGKISYYSSRAADHYEGKSHDEMIATSAAEYDKRKARSL